jgi:putative ABC transport system permease protein
MGIRLTLAARYIGGRRLRAFLTTLAVVFGVLVIFGMNIIVPTMLQSFQSGMMAATDTVDLTATLKSGNSFPAATLAKVKGVDGVRAAQGLLDRSVNLPADFYDHDPKAADRVGTLSLIGLDSKTARTVRPYPIRDGRFLASGDADAAVITASLAADLGLKLGDAMALPMADGLVHLTIVGLRAPRTVPGNEEVLVTLPEAQKLFAQPDQLASMEANFVSADAAKRSEIKSAVAAALGSGFTLETLSTDTNLFASLQAAKIGFNAFGVLALFMGAFIIFNTFRTIVAERRRDIGMLRAVGASRSTVVGTIVAEGLIQGLLGTAVGMLLGYLLASAGTAAYGSIMASFVHLSVGRPVVSLGIVIVSVILGVGTTLAAGLIPALSAGRVTPLEALRPVSDLVSYRRTVGAGAIVGIVFVILALAALASGSTAFLALGTLLFMVGLVLVAPALVRPLSLVFGAFLALLFARNATGTLAQTNLSRQPSRSAVTASTTMIALALIVALGGLTVSVSKGFLGVMRKSLGSDYIFVPPAIGVWQNDVGAKSGFADSLRGIDGVDRVSTLRYGAAGIDVAAIKSARGASAGSTTSILGIDPTDFPLVSGLSFSDGNAEKAFADLAGGRTIIVNPILAASLGLKVGDILPLETAEGRRDYRVVGVATDFMDAKIATAFISQDNLAGDFHRIDDIFIQLNLKPGADAAAAAAAIREAAQAYPQFSMIQGREYYNQMSDLFTAIFSAFYVLFLFMALPSLLTTINTLAISVLERTREIGMLRAVGTTKKQVSRTVLAEALLLAALGSVFGLTAGLYLGYLLVHAMASAGFPMPYVFPWGGLVSAVVIGLGFGALAAIIPARKAAGLQIVEALRYE